MKYGVVFKGSGDDMLFPMLHSKLCGTALQDARERIAARLGCQPDEIIFTHNG